MNEPYDLLISAGQVCCPHLGRSGPGTVAICGDRIVASGPDVEGAAKEQVEFPDGLLLPGLVDLHAHPATSGSKYGVDPDVEFLPRGVTTVLSQGDAGADYWPVYRQQTIAGSRTRVRLALNLCKHGERADGPCFGDLDWVDVDACAAVIEEAGDLIWGVSVNVSQASCVVDPREVLRRAIEVGKRTGKPLLYGMRNPSDWPIAEQLARLRPGDVVTYIFRPGEWSIVRDGQVLPEVREARQRGILFDACHGMQSFSFEVAEAAMADGFLPDTISTDQYNRHVGSSPQHDLPRTMSKFLAAGMPERDVLAAVTSRPAAILNLGREVGTLKPGSFADLTVLRSVKTTGPIADCCGVFRPTCQASHLHPTRRPENCVGTRANTSRQGEHGETKNGFRCRLSTGSSRSIALAN